MVTDRTATITLKQFEFTYDTPKLEYFDKTMIISSCGNPLYMKDIIFKGREILRKEFKGEPTNVNRIRSLTNAYYETRKNNIEEIILKRHLLTLEEYFKYYEKGTIWEKQAMQISSGINNYDLDLNFLVGAVEDTGASIYEISNPGTHTCHNFLGYHTIGSGKYYAMQTFLNHQYKINFSLKKALFIALEAKRNAEKMFEIGRKTDIRILSKEKMEIFQVSKKVIEELDGILTDKNTKIGNQNDISLNKVEKINLNLNI